MLLAVFMCKTRDKIANAFGLDEVKLRNLMVISVTSANIDEFGRFSDLKSTIDKSKAKEFIEAYEGKKIKPFEVNIKADELLRRFILEDGLDI